MVRYWMVIQNQTYQFEPPGGFLWSPKPREDGGRNQFYDYMTEVRQGGIVFSFCDALIRAVGFVQRPAITTPKRSAQMPRHRHRHRQPRNDVDCRWVSKPINHQLIPRRECCPYDFFWTAARERRS
jgi:hypothetical protein